MYMPSQDEPYSTRHWQIQWTIVNLSKFYPPIILTNAGIIFFIL